jgi:hypothetical protein
MTVGRRRSAARLLSSTAAVGSVPSAAFPEPCSQVTTDAWGINDRGDIVIPEPGTGLTPTST